MQNTSHIIPKYKEQQNPPQCGTLISVVMENISLTASCKRKAKTHHSVHFSIKARLWLSIHNLLIY